MVTSPRQMLNRPVVPGLLGLQSQVFWPQHLLTIHSVDLIMASTFGLRGVTDMALNGLHVLAKRSKGMPTTGSGGSRPETKGQGSGKGVPRWDQEAEESTLEQLYRRRNQHLAVSQVLRVRRRSDR
uniref:WGS project CBMG000000000 data, contig CS5907-c001237 n=1 Tax=Fusarium acuminatum CS5907 TaxID=1318461 RepID=A0A096PF13_9HYPO|nr:unnamed protein product [Fusarium acuminatum CS5907]